MNEKEHPTKSASSPAPADFTPVLPEGLIMRTIMNNSNDTIYFKDLESRFILNSKAHAVQFGLDEAWEMLGKDDSYCFPEPFVQAAREVERQIIASGRPVVDHVEKWFKPDGSVAWLMASKYPLYDADGRIIGTWGTSRDITPLKQAEEELARLNSQLREANARLEALSIRDSLSGLYNHRHFYETLNYNAAYALRQKECGCHSAFSVLLLDIDRFKTINDTHGHLIGDIVIRAVSARLPEVTRATDSCYRYGGDEFALILSGTELEAAREVAERLRSLIAETAVPTESGILGITASIGVASYSEAGSVEQLVHLADARLYLSKAGGRNRVT